MKNPKSIPVIIINYNQLFYLQKLVIFLQRRNFENIIIIDNKSTYPPLLEYYDNLKNVVIEKMDENYGHMVFFENEVLQKKYGKGYFILTDSDINFYSDFPKDYMKKMLNLLNRNYQTVTKVGLALSLRDIPDSYNLKEKVLKWEKRFWEEEIEKDVYKAPIDTTFALYLPGFPKKNSKNGFYQALRIGGKYAVKHGGWYHDSYNPTDEYLYYLKTANRSYSWKADENGKITGDLKELY